MLKLIKMTIILVTCNIYKNANLRLFTYFLWCLNENSLSLFREIRNGMFVCIYVNKIRFKSVLQQLIQL